MCNAQCDQNLFEVTAQNHELKLVCEVVLGCCMNQLNEIIDH